MIVSHCVITLSPIVFPHANSICPAVLRGDALCGSKRFRGAERG
jgi:hypothetical protein